MSQYYIPVASSVSNSANSLLVLNGAAHIIAAPSPSHCRISRRQPKASFGADRPRAWAGGRRYCKVSIFQSSPYPTLIQFASGSVTTLILDPSPSRHLHILATR